LQRFTTLEKVKYYYWKTSVFCTGYCLAERRY